MSKQTNSVHLDKPFAEPDTSVKPCPFCGCTVISDGEVLTGYPNGKTTTQSMCSGCKALGAEAELDTGEIDYGDVKAIAAWNRRACNRDHAFDDLGELIHRIGDTARAAFIKAGSK